MPLLLLVLLHVKARESARFTQHICINNRSEAKIRWMTRSFLQRRNAEIQIYTQCF